MKVGVAVADLFTGLYASNAILAALLHARATGDGQQIDMALFEAQAAMLANQASNFFVSGRPPARMGNAHPNLAPYQPFPTADGAVVIAVGNDGQFRALARALGQEGLADDARFRSNALRVGHRSDLAPLIGGLTGARTTGEWIAALEAAGVPCGPINTVDKVFEEAQAKARGLVVEQTRPDLDAPVRTVASPMRLSKTPVSYRSAPPALGADTREVLARHLGLSDGDLDALDHEGVIG
jgi:crotonobetainyl-CoA:carnitine CoA-transferase CaiB-like acyl-CoA transferase